ncbi:MAG: hypothetical protein ACLP2P_00620 [Desulfobaccales bacterium]
MSKKSDQSLTPEKIAEREKKNWKAVTVIATDAVPGVMPDAVTPELGKLKERYGGAAQNEKTGAANNTSESTMVVMEPRDAADTRVGRKTVLIKDGKIHGEQG